MRISQLYAGKPQAFGPRNAPSSIIKKAHTKLNVLFDGALEDEQGNKKLHGGPFMALHQYAQENYAKLSLEFPNTAQEFSIGSIGENLSAPSMNEKNVFIGDQYKIGSCILEVVSPRAPCSKINHRYGKKGIDSFIAQTGMTGWYYKVIQEGSITIGDEITCLNLGEREERFNILSIWTFRNINIDSLKDLSGDDKHLRTEIQQMVDLGEAMIKLPSLSPEWVGYITRKLNKLKARLKS